MISSKCPGQDTRYWKHEDIQDKACPECGEPMEFWKTDIRLRCKKCGRMVENPEFDLGCAEWCSYAEYCLGDVVKGYKPETVKKKLKTTAERLLDDSEMQQLEKELAKSRRKAEEEGLDVLVVIASTVFEAIGKKHGWEKVQEIVERMEVNREIKPEIIEKLRQLPGEVS